MGPVGPKNPSVREIKEELEQALELKTGGHFVKNNQTYAAAGRNEV